jgi:ubiquinone/menaquinone biosynthesis C-methylase UbiE
MPNAEILNKWPKTIPELSPEQQKAREGFMLGWHQILPNKYSIVEKFNHAWVAKLPLPSPCKTLEIGAGLGEHFFWEDVSKQDYYQLEYREEFCKILRDNTKSDLVVCGDIQERTPFEDKTFDRLVIIHVLEHLPRLPDALRESSRILKDDGVFDIVLPCEGGIAYTMARRISAQRYFEKTFKMDYGPIWRSEHINTGQEVMDAISCFFEVESSSYFPLKIPVQTVNLCIALRVRKKKS